MTSQYETVFIMTPVLSQEQMGETVKKYKKILTDGGTEIVAEENWGLRKLAYPIQKKSTGFYFSVEFKGSGKVISEMEVFFKRDERILRFLTVKLDKHAIAYSIKRRSKSKEKGDETAPVQSSPSTGQIDKKSQDKEKQDIVVNKESQDKEKQAVVENKETQNKEKQEVVVNKETQVKEKQEVVVDKETQDKEKQEVVVNKETQDEEKQEVVVDKETQDKEKQEVVVNKETQDKEKEKQQKEETITS